MIVYDHWTWLGVDLIVKICQHTSVTKQEVSKSDWELDVVFAGWQQNDRGGRELWDGPVRQIQTRLAFRCWQTQCDRAPPLCGRWSYWTHSV